MKKQKPDPTAKVVSVLVIDPTTYLYVFDDGSTWWRRYSGWIPDWVPTKKRERHRKAEKT